MDTTITPFTIQVPEPELADLHDRLARTRWVGQLPGEGWRPGVPVDYLRELAEHWRTGFDWRAQETLLNHQYPQYLTEIAGYRVHFAHVRSPEPDALPLILTHGWPNSFVEFTKVIGPLTEPRRFGTGGPAFHVVVPSVPGFGYSDPPLETGFDVAAVARLWAELMHRLGYRRYGTQGGDLGAYIAPEVAVADPAGVVGVHVNGGLGFPGASDLPQLTEAERAEWSQLQQWFGGGVDHHALMHAAPQTFAYGWHDSPVGLLAWMMQKFQEFTPMVELPEHAIERDHILTNVSIYWFTGTSGTSSWPGYLGTADAGGFSWPTGQTVAPTGVYSGGPPLCRTLAERHNKIIHWPEGNPGNHFVAMEEPLAHAADIREFFSKLC